jgi:hypothetical protein
VFLVRAAALGEAIVRFVPSAGADAEPREIRIAVIR